MKNSAIEKINAMDDFQIIRCYEKFSQSILSKSTSSISEIMKELPESLELSSTIKNWSNLSEETINKELKGKEAAEFSRNALAEFAKNPLTSEVFDKFMESYEDKEMVVETVLLLGGVISMIMLAATSKFEYKNGKVELGIGTEKGPEGLKALKDLVVGIFGAIPTSLMNLLKN